MRRFDGAPIDAQLLSTMSAQLTHRGPDDEGLLIKDSVGFGHRRLSIIDIEGSTQPMSSFDGTLHVCFNGEILNYKELRRETPYPYRTAGDTEVLLSTFDRHGAGAVSRLIGQFAYALYSERDGLLWLFRDRLGILPLYYYSDESVFVFGSEIKALLPALPARPQVDVESLGAYLAHRSVPAPWTLFDGIRKLPPGCSLRVAASGMVGDPVQYWEVPRPSVTRRVSSGLETQELESVLLTSVRRNLVADVPVGAYLSGGLDSSLVVALMRAAAPDQEIRTFAATFGDPRFDESIYARRVAAAQRTIHEEVRVKTSEFEDLWALLTWHRDGPISEASDVAVYQLAKLAAQHVKVVLSGEGSDELFGGYPKHRFAALGYYAGLVPGGVRRSALTALEHGLPLGAARQRILVRALSESTEAARLEGWFAPFTARERAHLLMERPEHRRTADLKGHGDPLRRMLVWDIGGWLTDNLLERGDRMSMASSVELRPPFLDADVVAKAFELPSHLKLKAGQGKWILRQVARSYLSQEIIDRPKLGFRVPLDVWFRGPLRDLVCDTLLSTDGFIATTLSRKPVEDLLRRHMQGRANEELRIWTLLSLEIWHRTFFTSRPLFRTGDKERLASGRRVAC